jgi:Winged helix-turn helix
MRLHPCSAIPLGGFARLSSAGIRLVSKEYVTRGSHCQEPPACSLSSKQELDHALDQLPADGGLWSGPKVAAWMAERLGRPVDPRRGWDYLQRLGRSTRVPRPQHEESDQATQQAFKKTYVGNLSLMSFSSRAARYLSGDLRKRYCMRRAS